MIRCFVTGTDTDAGKTRVSCGLLLAARARGLRARGYKPVESGSATSPGPDALALAKAGGHEALTSFCYRTPIVPSRAAELENSSVHLDRIEKRAQELAQDCDLLLIEGAGGFLVPLTSTETIADLVQRLSTGLILVVADRLGCINHALLTIEAARARGVPISAVVLNAIQAQPDPQLGNQEQIAAMSGLAVQLFPHCTTEHSLREAGDHLLTALLADAES